MHRPFFIAASALGAVTSHAADLTPAEARWLQASQPALAYARQQRLPLDVTFDPHAKAGDAPLSMGFADGHCQLVFAIRGNPDAQDTLAGVEPELLNPVVEAMVAHELGHCWRFVRGAWRTVPAGFVEGSERGRDSDWSAARLRRDMREARREEGYADLVGLAWTLTHHPAQYDQVHAWFCRVRDDQPVPGAHHDTRAWLRLARDPGLFPSIGSPFEQASTVWQQGLRSED
jgi:hypothetical protein